MTPKERKDRFTRLTRLGCIVCREVHGLHVPANIHHLTGIKYRATGKRAGDENSIPLCHFHHQGAHGIHHIGMRAWESRFGTQERLLAETNRLILGLH